MCNSNNNLTGTLLPFGLKIPAPGPSHGGLLATAGHPLLPVGGGPPPAGAGGLSPAALELHRAQLYDYNARLRFGLHYAAAAAAAAGHHPGLGGPYPPHHPGHPPAHPPGAGDPMAAYLYGKQVGDPRLRYLHEEPKPSHSYIGLIAMAILSSKEKKLVLSDIYQWILDNYPYFRSRGPGWRNSIRHNLSLNDCFIKSGRSANGKGHYWAIHPANVEDFSKGDFRRRRAQRKVRKAMGLAVPDEEDSPSPPPPTLTGTPLDWQNRVLLHTAGSAGTSPGASRDRTSGSPCSCEEGPRPGLVANQLPVAVGHKKRLFDVESLLAPDSDNVQQQRADGPSLSSPSAAVKDVKIEDEGDIVEVGSPVKVEEPPAPTPSPPCSSPASSPPPPRDSPPATPASGSSPPPPAPPRLALPGPTPHQALWTWDRHHPSAFHAFPGAAATALPGWGTLHPHGYPLMAPASLGAAPGEQGHKWQETFSRIMARAGSSKPATSPPGSAEKSDS